MRRAALVATSVLVALAGTVGLIAFFQSRDDAGLDGAAAQASGDVAPAETAPELRAGNIVITYRRTQDGAALRALADEVAGPPDAALRETGQAILVRRRASQPEPVVAHAYRRRFVARAPGDAGLRTFVEARLGQPEVE